MSEKRPYSAPQLFRVELNHEQAILSQCSLTTNAAMDGGNIGCKSNCKSFSGGGSDSGPRMS